MKFKNTILNKRGAALIFVMVSMLIVFMMISIAASVSQANIKQASAQEDGLKAYYIARSGVELAYEAIMTKSLLAGLKIAALTDEVSFGTDGTAKITVTSPDPVSPAVEADRKVIIQSIGTSSKSGTERTVTLEFYYDYGTKKDMKWSN